MLNINLENLVKKESDYVQIMEFGNKSYVKIPVNKEVSFLYFQTRYENKPILNIKLDLKFIAVIKENIIYIKREFLEEFSALDDKTSNIELKAVNNLENLKNFLEYPTERNTSYFAIKNNIIKNKIKFYINIPINNEISFLYRQNYYNSDNPILCVNEDLIFNGIVHNEKIFIEGHIENEFFHGNKIQTLDTLENELITETRIKLKELVQENLHDLKSTPLNEELLGEIEYDGETSAYHNYIQSKSDENNYYLNSFNKCFASEDIIEFLTNPTEYVSNAAKKCLEQKKDTIVFFLLREDIIKEKMSILEKNKVDTEKRNIFASLMKSKNKTVNITFQKESQEFSFKYNIKQYIDIYSRGLNIKYIPAKDRKVYLEKFPSDKFIQFSDIIKISSIKSTETLYQK